MNALTETLPSARYSMGYVIVRFPSGEEIRFPVAENARLAGKPEAALNRIEVSPFGLHWTELDEDLSFSDCESATTDSVFRHGRQSRD